MKKSVLLVSILLAIACSSACHADTGDNDKDDKSKSDDTDDMNFRPTVTDFTGSQYAPSDFLDFKVFGSEFAQMKDAAERRLLPESSRGFDRLNLSALKEDQDENAEPDADMNKLQPVQNRLLDWVPDKVDRLQNGGFSTSPDNGRPVPYRLNGHVGIERGYPWAPSN